MTDRSLGTEQLLPFERADSPADVRKSLLSALDSELGSEQPEDDEPAADEAPKADAAESDDDEPDDDAGEDDSDESDDDEDAEGDEDEGPKEDPLHEVIVDGQTQRITLKEALAGYQRQADYTRGKVALAREKESLSAELTQIRGARDQYAQRLEAYGLALKDIHAAQEPNWDKLEAEDPARYAVEWAKHQRLEKKRAEVEAEQRKVFEERQADFQAQQEARKRDETAKLLDAVPEWKDDAKAEAEANKLISFAERRFGFTRDDIAGWMDHRALLMLRDAMRYNEGQTKGKEKIAGKVKPASAPLKPGSRDRAPGREHKSAAKRDRARLARTGRVDDAAAFIARGLLDE